MFIPILVDVSRKFEDTFDKGCSGPSYWADDSIAWPEEPEAAGGTAEYVLACELSPPPENPGEKASGLPFWEFESPLYVERDAEDALLQIPRTQARRVVGAVGSDGQIPSVKSNGMHVTEIQECQPLLLTNKNGGY